MKKVLIGSAILLLSSAVSAQASTFEGSALGFGLGAASADFVPSNETYFGSSYGYYGGSSLGQSSMVPRIEYSYTKAFAGKMLLDGG